MFALWPRDFINSSKAIFSHQSSQERQNLELKIVHSRKCTCTEHNECKSSGFPLKTKKTPCCIWHLQFVVFTMRLTDHRAHSSYTGAHSSPRSPTMHCGSVINYECLVCCWFVFDLRGFSLNKCEPFQRLFVELKGALCENRLPHDFVLDYWRNKGCMRGKNTKDWRFPSGM